jgi:hypothetical protein
VKTATEVIAAAVADMILRVMVVAGNSSEAAAVAANAG